MSGIEIKNDGTVTRQTIPNDPRDDSEYKVSSGYDYPPDQEFLLPDCGIFEADEAITLLFRNTIGFDVKEIWAQNEKVKIEKPQVIFSGGERWALAKKKVPPMDRNRQLILPAINIRRTDISFSTEEQKRGMSDKSGNLIVKRKLSGEFDRDYQNIINKLGLRHLSGLPTSVNDATSIIEESAKEAVRNPIIREGGLLQPVIGNNVYEILSIPLPKFFIAKYEIVFWTSEIEHMNYMMETLYTSTLAQEIAFKLVTPAGYWFMGTFQQENQNSSNFEDYKDERRIVRYKFNMDIKGFILPTQRGKSANPVRRWVFAPRLNLDIIDSEVIPFDKKKLKMQQDIVGVPSSPDNGDNHFPLFSLSSDLESATETSQKPESSEKTLYEKTVYNPITNKKSVVYATEKSRYDRSGETITRYSSKKAMEQIRMAAYNERLGRYKNG